MLPSAESIRSECCWDDEFGGVRWVFWLLSGIERDPDPSATGQVKSRPQALVFDESSLMFGVAVWAPDYAFRSRGWNFARF